jgi:hypothetical protein
MRILKLMPEILIFHVISGVLTISTILIIVFSVRLKDGLLVNNFETYSNNFVLEG